MGVNTTFVVVVGTDPELQFAALVQLPPLGFPQPPAMTVRLKVTGALTPVLPAASVSLATMLWLPSPDNVTDVLQLPLAPTVAVPIWTPLSYSVTVAPAATSVAVTVPLMV